MTDAVDAKINAEINAKTFWRALGSRARTSWH
jgi:hypothetical protein